MADAAVKPRDLVLDIGAGTGAISAALLERGARVVAVELHPGRAESLRRQFGEQLVVVQTDASDLRLPRQPFRVVANPPFALSVSILRRLTWRGSRLISADVVLPAFAASRWSSHRAPGAARWQREFTARTVRRLPDRALRPRATMPTAVLRIERRKPPPTA